MGVAWFTIHEAASLAQHPQASNGVRRSRDCRAYTYDMMKKIRIG
jgi:hypothetical protein